MELDNPTIVLILYCILAFVLAFYPAYLIFPRFIRKMKSLGNTGKDVNKRGNIQVAESGGIVAVFSFSLAMFVISGLASISNYHENIVLPLQAATTVFIAAAIIGFIQEEDFTNHNNLRLDADDRLSGRRCRRLGLIDPPPKGLRDRLREVRWNAQGISCYVTAKTSHLCNSKTSHPC